MSSGAQDHAAMYETLTGVSGTATWVIPAQYYDILHMRVDFDTTTQIHKVFTNGNTEESKGGHSETTQKSDPTVLWPCEHTDYDAWNF